MMKGKAVLLLSGVGLSVVLLACQGARAGPLAGEAQARVDQAVAIMPQDLNAAETMLKSVEVDYPEEVEAIGWAHYRLSEIYWAGERWFDAAGAVRWSWDRIQEGVLTDEDQKFWCGYQYARCLNRLTVGTLLADVCSGTLDVYDAKPVPGEGQQNAAGWLHYYRAQCEYAAGEFGVAEAEAHLAWEDGKAVQNGSLASWARLLEARAAMAGGNLLLAEGVLNDCLNDYAPHMAEDYAGEARVRLSQCQVMTGRLGQAHDAVIDLFNNPGVDQGLQAEALVRLGEAAMTEGATAEAVRALALANNAFGGVPTWGDIAKARWNSLLEGQDAFALLLEASGGGSGPERAAVELELARRERDAADALSRCDAAEAYSSDPQIKREIDLVRAEKSGGDQLAVYASLLRPDMSAGERNRILRGALEASGSICSQTWAAWLDANRAKMPRAVYLCEEMKRLQRCPKDWEKVLSVCEELLEISYQEDERVEAHARKITALYGLGRQAEAQAAIQDLETQVSDKGKVEYALVFAGDFLYWHLDDCEVGFWLLRKAMDSGSHPVWPAEARFLLARSLFQQRRLEEARTVAEGFRNIAVTEQNSKIVGQGLSDLGGLCMRTERYVRGLEWFRLVWSDPVFPNQVREEAGLREAKERLARGEAVECLGVCQGIREAAISLSHQNQDRLNVIEVEAMYDAGQHNEAIGRADALLAEVSEPKAKMTLGDLLREWR